MLNELFQFSEKCTLNLELFCFAGGTGLKLQDALADPELGGRKAVISHASRVLAGIWEKGMVAHTFIHRVLNEYLAEVHFVALRTREPALRPWV
jgi:hypothetical protein